MQRADGLVVEFCQRVERRLHDFDFNIGGRPKGLHDTHR